MREKEMVNIQGGKGSESVNGKGVGNTKKKMLKEKKKKGKERREKTKSIHINWLKSESTMTYSSFTCEID